MSTQSLTLYEIDCGLYDLYERRQELAEQICPTAQDIADRDLMVRQIDEAIGTVIKTLDRRVDGIAYLVREFQDRALIHKAEADRLWDVGKREQAIAAETKQRAAEVLALRLTPELIERNTDGKFHTLEEVTQGTKLLEVRGKHNTLKLCKNPPSVAEAIDMSLLPEDLLSITVTMRADTWKYILSLSEDAGRDGSGDVLQAEVKDGSITVSELKPHKTEIAARLKQMVPCEKCGGKGKVFTGRASENLRETESCSECGGTGQVRASVPGAHLIEDGVHLRIG